MTKANVMARLDALGNPKVHELNVRGGYQGDQFGVKLGDLRSLAKEIKLNPELAQELWQTGNLDAQLLATLLMRPKLFSADDVDAMVRSVSSAQLIEWVMTNVVRQHPAREELRQRWMKDSHPMAARAGWGLTADAVIKGTADLDVIALLDRLDREMPSAPELVKWTMNFCLGYIGIHHPEHRTRVLEMGVLIGAYRDYPTSKGCTSPFVPIWVNEMVRRQGG